MSTAFICLVLATLFSLITTSVSLWKLIYFGRQLSRRETVIRAQHIEWVDRFLISLASTVVLVELMVLERGGRQGDPLLFKFHFYLDVILLGIFFSMRRIWTGNVNPAMHKKLSKYFFAVLAGVVITGSILAYQVFLKL